MKCSGWKDRLDDRYVFTHRSILFDQAQTTEINFTEQSYLPILQLEHVARLKQRACRSSATLKVDQPPSFDRSDARKRKVMVLAAFFGSMIFILDYFILLRAARPDAARPGTSNGLPRTRAGRLPAPGKFRFRSCTKACGPLASQYPGQCGTQLFQTGKPNVINLLAQTPAPAKKFPRRTTRNLLRRDRAKRPAGHLSSRFHRQAKNYLLARNPEDFIPVLGPEAGRRT